jgi:hypothetical protein
METSQSATNRTAQLSTERGVDIQYWKHAIQIMSSGTGISDKILASADIPRTESRPDSIEVMSFSMNAHANGRTNSNSLRPAVDRRL